MRISPPTIAPNVGQICRCTLFPRQGRLLFRAIDRK